MEDSPADRCNQEAKTALERRIGRALYAHEWRGWIAETADPFQVPPWHGVASRLARLRAQEGNRPLGDVAGEVFDEFLASLEGQLDERRLVMEMDHDQVQYRYAKARRILSDVTPRLRKEFVNAVCRETEGDSLKPGTIEMPQARRGPDEIDSLQGKPGPRPDIENHRIVRGVVDRYGDQWRNKLEAICSELDERHAKVSRAWKDGGFESWSAKLQQDPARVRKAIEYIQKNVRPNNCR